MSTNPAQKGTPGDFKAETESTPSRAERVAGLDELRQSELQLRTILDTVPAITWRSGPDGYMEFLNKRYSDYTGLTQEQAQGSNWQIAIHPDDLQRLLSYWMSVLASGEPAEIEARLRRSDGEYRWFLFRGEPARDEHGAILKWFGTNVDIDDRKRAEDRLRQEEREHRETLDAIPAFVYVIDNDANVLYKNRATLDLVGETQSDSEFSRYVHADDLTEFQLRIREGLAHGAPFQVECRVWRAADRTYRWYVTMYKPLRDEQERILRWYAAATDIDDRKKSEERVRGENVVLREEIDRSSLFEEIVGSSACLRRVLANVAKVAPGESTVLILGETGTGKELIARAIHKQSKRSARAFIRVNCAAISPSLIAAELFGHEKGAFTGATQRRLGRFEAANGGTIFLDEIGDLPAETQIALLRVLQEREFERVGSNQPIPVDVRVIAATNRNLKAAVAANEFRQDLYFRLNVFPIELPALRQRGDDIPLLAEYLIERYASKAGKKIRHISKRTLDLLQAYDWPGNIRELQNVVERAVVLCEGDTFTVDDAWLKREAPPAGPTIPLDAAVEGREKEMIQAALSQSRGRISGPNGAAAKLGIPRQTLDSKIASLGINKHLFKDA